MATTFICRSRQTQTEICDYLKSNDIAYIKVSTCLGTEPVYTVKIYIPTEKEIKVSI